MYYIAHRINTIKELRTVPEIYGVELDLRDSLDGTIYVQHNPFEPGDNFEDYLKEYRHKMMILNIKSERIEFKIQELLKKYGIKEYFFLDSSFPMIYLLTNKNEHNIAIRVSELEGLGTARNMAGKANWIWVDCFTKIPIGRKEYDELRKMGYMLCFVSPELEGRDEDIESYKTQLIESGMEMDAICTKIYNIDRWNENE